MAGPPWVKPTLWETLLLQITAALGREAAKNSKNDEDENYKERAGRRPVHAGRSARADSILGGGRVGLFMKRWTSLFTTIRHGQAYSMQSEGEARAPRTAGVDVERTLRIATVEWPWPG